MIGRTERVMAREVHAFPRDRLRAWLVPVLGLVAVGVAAASLVTPWWVIQEQGTFFHYPFNATYEFRPFGWSFTEFMPSGPSPYPNRTLTQSGDYTNMTRMGPVFSVGAVLDVAGAVCAAGTVALAAFPRLKPSWRKRAPILGILGFVLLLAAAIYVMIQLPAAANEDLFPPSWYLYGSSPVVSGFWGSGLAGWSHGGAAVTYGAGWAWYALIAAAGLLLVDAVLLLHGQGTRFRSRLRRQHPA